VRGLPHLGTDGLACSFVLASRELPLGWRSRQHLADIFRRTGAREASRPQKRRRITSRIPAVPRLKSENVPAIAILAVLLAILGNMALAAQDKYAVQVPGGLAFSEFKGYEDWQTVSVSKTEHAFAVILANPVMIDAYRAGVPGNGKPFPDGSKMAKIHWKPEKSAEAPDPTTAVPGTLLNVDFMERDSKRFADSGGWGWAAFDYDAASDTFTPATEADQPPQANDAKCGFACHTIVQAKDYVFTAYPKR
jgi:cytochrome P460